MSSEKRFSRQQLQRFLAERQPKERKELISRPKEKKKKNKTKNAFERSLDLNLRSRERLRDSRFRALNEFFGSHSSSAAKQRVSEDVFRDYHNSYDHVASKWPQRPSDHVIARIRTLLNPDSRPVVADIGCGPEPLLQNAFPSLHVHSFDLVALNSRVISAEMTSLPLKKSSVDIVVYCLSLMATDLKDILLECRRILKDNGMVIIAEVSSRFDGNPKLFVERMRGFGFHLEAQEAFSQDFFVWFQFKKVALEGGKGARVPEMKLKPVFYKTR